MKKQDQEKWDAKYRSADDVPSQPSILLTDLADLLPLQGRGLDLAGGAGRHAIWLAQRSLKITLADISPVGLKLAEQRAQEAGVEISTICVDLESEPPPEGPWQLIVLFQFLWRPLFGIFPRLLAPGGLMILSQPTRSNLTRHARPPEPFLLEDGELPTLVQDLELLVYQKGWSTEGRHDALIVARKNYDIAS